MSNAKRIPALLLSVVFLLTGLLPLAVHAAVPGDLDGSGTLDSDDAILLLYHVMLPSHYPYDGYIDFDGNGDEDSGDAVLLLYHSLLPDAFPLVLPSAVSLPQVGYDPDGKGRIQLSSIAMCGLTVTLSFSNRSAVWVTDETSALTYTCTNKAGTVLKTGTLVIGYISSGATRTYTLTLPQNTARLSFTDSDVTYWSQWKP